MQTRVYSIIGKRERLVEVFAHRSKSIPGIEIIGIGKWARLVKEKIVYFFKFHQIPMGSFKYTVCLEGPFGECRDYQEVQNLELTVFFIILYLSENLEFYSFDGCLVWGMLNCEGEIVQPFNLEVDKLIEESKMSIISHREIIGKKIIELESLLTGISRRINLRELQQG